MFGRLIQVHTWDCSIVPVSTYATAIVREVHLLMLLQLLLLLLLLLLPVLLLLLLLLLIR